ncbi:2-oxoisovalerate dehydrogenase E1 component subunit beta [mine drainage metagenome]|uniref:2-oxoisovalerate dehydrogenase E1 component subunit beta n=1 Tax=mine drainage metagenome TaxID=410659 RepID=T1CGA7_9ZZZZ
MAMNEVVFLVEDAAEGGLTARALGHSIHTEADTFGELRLQVRDAVQCHFDEGARPAVIRLHYVKDEVLAA